MKIRVPGKRPLFSLTLLCALACAQASLGQSPLDYFELSDGWKRAESISLSPSGDSFHAVDSPDGNILYSMGIHDDAGFLLTRQSYGDSTLSLEFMVPEGSEAALFVLSRYELKLSAGKPGAAATAETAGAIAGGFDKNEEQPFPPSPPMLNAAKPAGEWQTLEIRFRPLRNDAAFNKVAPSLLIEAKLNGDIVQLNQPIPYYTPGSLQEWENDSAPHGVRGSNGPIAIRNVFVGHADYETVVVPKDGTESNLDELVDHVELGKRTFTELGCIECHTTKENDTSFKTGPNLYGLFTREPRKRAIQEQGGDKRFFIKADSNYLLRSLREPATELAIAESGAKEGEAYLPVMPPYNDQIISDIKVAAMYSYLGTLNDPPEQGPVEVLVEETGPKFYDPLEDTMLLLVDDRTRIQRGSMLGLSGRAIHVGLPNGINYSFDPRTLGIEKLWQGGFINGSGEWQNRGGGGFAPGFDNKEISLAQGGSLIAPLLSSGERVDFSFKEALFKDWETIAASLHSDVDHLDMLARIDAAFLGYTIDSAKKNAAPVFEYRIEDNRIELQTAISVSGEVSIALTGLLASPQSFALNTQVLESLNPSVGKVDAKGNWTVPASGKISATLRGKMSVASSVWRPESSDSQHLRQARAIAPTEAELPTGYRSEQYLPPKDNYGRPLLFEPTGIDVAPDGTIVVATRTSGIWRIVDGEWRLFAEGIFDSLGVVVEDERGLKVVVGQKPELTRVSDINGDEIADSFATLSDQFSYHSNYHSYLHGPARDEEGNYYYSLNLLHTDEAIYKAQGLYMGTSGGFSGWAIKITPEGDFIPWANGLRSPAGLATGPDGRIWYSENQGEFVGTSKLFVLEEDKFYGHPSGLVDLPGMTPDSPEIQWPAVAQDRERAVALFPHNLVANSPGNPAWAVTGGAFGAYEGQMFIGDQTQSRLFRVSTEVVDGKELGAVIPFGSQLQSGIMRPVFLPDGSLLIGQTGRGWQARGGNIASLQRITWDGVTVAPDILEVSQSPDAYTLTFTQPLRSTVTAGQLQNAATIRSWMYRDAPDYGSPELDEIDEQIDSVSISEDRKSARFRLKPSEKATHPQQTSRVYHIRLDTSVLFDGDAPESLEAYVTSY